MNVETLDRDPKWESLKVQGNFSLPIVTYEELDRKLQELWGY